MLTGSITDLFKCFRLMNYRQLFGRIRERDGSLSATEAYTVDVIFLLDNPTVTQLADTLGISQPNATYKVNNLVAKGYVTKTVSEGDRRESDGLSLSRVHVQDQAVEFQRIARFAPTERRSTPRSPAAASRRSH